MTGNKKLWLLGAMCFCVWGALPFSVSAAMHTQAPVVIDLSIQPRDIIDEKIVLTNTGVAKLTLFAFVSEVTGGLEGGVSGEITPSMVDRTKTFVSWIELPRTVELAPNETKEVPLTVKVGPQAQGGEYHAKISFASGSTVDEAQRQVVAGNAPTTFINATLEEKHRETANLSRFSIKRFITGYHDGDVRYRVENSGDVAIVPTGDMVIYNQKGEEVATVPVNPDKRSLGPGEQAVFTTGIAPEGLLGKYKAHLTMRYGSGQAAVYDTVYFFALPLWKVLVAFAIFVGSALALSLLIHSRARRRSRADSVEDDGMGDYAQSIPLTTRSTASATHPRDIVMK